MNCQHCDNLQMDHVEYKGTHIHKCPNCPNVSFDHVFPEDIDNLKDYLTKETNQP